MAFSGLDTKELIDASLAGQDVSELISILQIKEAPFLDWLGTPVQASAIKHEYVQDFHLPNKLVTSTAINSVTTATGATINGLGEALTVGTLLEIEGLETLQVTSIAGANSILVSRTYGGGDPSSLAVGGTLIVRGPAAIEGQDHTGANTKRFGTILANTVGYFAIEVSASGSQLVQNVLGANRYEDQKAKAIAAAPLALEQEIVRGIWNSTNSLGTTAVTRTMKGIRNFLTTISSTITASSFAASPHTYLGNVWEQVFDQGGSPTETWAIVAGSTFYRNLSDLNDTKVYDSNAKEEFKRVIRLYTGPFGQAEIFYSRALKSTELLLVPRERVKPVVYRPWQMLDIAKSGDNVKAMLVGEYTLEVHHENAMARLRV
jgi:hypothetical protein